MRLGTHQACSCGSGKLRYELRDARGIFCNYVCDACIEKKKAGYRPEIFTNPRYWTDEAVEEDGEPDPGDDY